MSQKLNCVAFGGISTAYERNTIKLMEDKMKRRNLCVMGMVVMLAANVAFAATKALEWKFENNLSDTSGNAIDGTIFGTETYSTGVSGQAFYSDGSSCVYQTGIDTSILPVLGTDTWSVNIWVWPDGNPWYLDVNNVQKSWRIAFYLGDKSSNSRMVYCSDSGGVAFTDSKQRYIGTGIPWDVNQWQMVTATYDGTYVRIYKNGALIGKKTFTFTDAPGEVRVPNYPWSDTTNFFKGKFDEFTVWRGALTQQEIIALIPPGILPEGAYLDEVAYYTLEDPCDDDTMPDHSGYSNTATLTGFNTYPLVDNWVVPGRKGGALLFNYDSYNLIGQAVTLPAGVTVSQYPQHSVAFWFKSGYQPFNSAFYSEGLYPKDNGSQLQIRGDAGTTGTIKIYSKDQWYTTLYSITYDASAYMDSTTWHHFAFTSDGDKVKLYLDGQFITDSNVTGLEGKTAMNKSSIGFSWDGLHYLGEWDKTYVDDFHLYKGVLTQEQVQALAARGNANNDLKVDLFDLDDLANQWLTNTTSVAGSTLLVDNMEGSLANWSVYASGTYTGTGTISSTTNAYAGSKAMQWDYNLPARVGGNYSSIVYNLVTDRDLTGYDSMKLYLYRHAGNTPEANDGVMYVQFYNSSMALQAESFIYGPNSVVVPANQWAQWYINLNAKLHQSGSTYVDKSVLTNVRYIMIGCGSSRADARVGTIDIDEVKFLKYPTCAPYLTADVGSLEYKDCKVDMSDLAAFVDGWRLGVN
jgi:hypothetical protein